MKILLLTGRHLPLIGGVEIHVDRVASELTRRKHDVTVQCTTPGWKGLTYEYKIRRVSDDHNRFIPAEKYDIIACQDFYTYSDKLREYAPKITMTFHGWEGRYPPEESVVQKRQIIKEKCDGSIGVGMYLERWYGTKCDFNIWGGIGAEDIVPMDKMEPQRFIWVGGLRDDMDLMSYLGLLACLKNDGWEPKLDIVGGGHPKVEESLLEYIGSYNLDVDLHGWMDEYSELYEKASYVFAGGYLSMLKGLANFKSVISLWTNNLKRDYVEWFPGKLITASVISLEDITLRIREGIPPEVMEGNRQWALSQSWSSIADVYEELWQKK